MSYAKPLKAFWEGSRLIISTAHPVQAASMGLSADQVKQAPAQRCRFVLPHLSAIPALEATRGFQLRLPRESVSDGTSPNVALYRRQRSPMWEKPFAKAAEDTDIDGEPFAS